MDLDETIERALHTPDENDFDPMSLGPEFEKAGDPAFDEVLRRLNVETTSDTGRIVGLRMLALLSRQFCVSRRPDLLDVSLRLIDHPNVRVRSAALHSAVFNASHMRRLGAFPHAASAAAVQRVKEAASRAVGRGLEPESEELARRFIASDGEMRIVADE